MTRKSKKQKDDGIYSNFYSIIKFVWEQIDKHIDEQKYNQKYHRQLNRNLIIVLNCDKIINTLFVINICGVLKHIQLETYKILNIIWGGNCVVDDDIKIALGLLFMRVHLAGVSIFGKHVLRFYEFNFAIPLAVGTIPLVVGEVGAIPLAVGVGVKGGQVAPFGVGVRGDKGGQMPPSNNVLVRKHLLRIRCEINYGPGSYYDYDDMKKTKQNINCAIMEYIYHPSRIIRFPIN